jgi:Heterokaryon incompatibility protein (HET)
MSALPLRAPPPRTLSNVVYEPLDLTSKQPSIRLAILRPAPREGTIRITLAHATFASRPRYEALSYTWGNPNEVKAIELNGSPVNIRDNLWSALVSLRDAREERVLWIDAICINQSDVEERNRQVQLMAHIYSRAKQVIVWLGTLNGPLAGTSYAEQEAVELKQDEVKDLCNRPYWKRVWIVQEIGAATQLQLRWGAGFKSDSWDCFFQYSIPRGIESQIAPAMKLYHSRQGRHGDNFLLANLMEACKDSLCAEPRDKVYGYVGIAHDCQDGSFPIDYSKSLFELYEDVVRFQYRNVKLSVNSIVPFSQLVQRLLGGPKAMLEDLSRTRPGQPTPLTAPQSIKDRPNILKVTGVFGGSISTVGPSYDEIIGIPDATRSWKVVLSKCQADMEQLRKKNEGFMRVLLELDNADVDRVHPIDPEFSWRWSKEMREILKEKDSMSRSEWELIPVFKFGPDPESKKDGSPQQLHLFATGDGTIGLMPHTAREGDLLFQFWDSDVVAVVRLDGSYHMRVIGRAVIANDKYMEEEKFLKPMGIDTHPRTGLNFDKGVDLYIDVRTLQLITQ